MQFRFKKIQNTAQNKLKKPICNQKKELPVRICTNQKCSNTWNQIMCGIIKCTCNNKAHQQCYSFINFDCFNNLINDFHEKSNEQVFKSILKSLLKLVQDATLMYNKALYMYQNYLIPQPLLPAKKSMNKQGTIPKQQALKLKKFYDQLPQYYVPSIKTMQKPRLILQELQKTVSNFEKEQIDFYKKIFKTLIQYENIGKQIMQQMNIERKNQTQNRKKMSMNKSAEKMSNSQRK